MPKINLLPRETAELIAAGEVVERPASVVKELIENSIDAGAKHITVELVRGGIMMIRIADDGCGISKEDVPVAFKRHATSKIKSASDLDTISTLGFRGEALAAVSSVAKVEMFTKPKEEELGTHYRIEGGREIFCDDCGCPDGTTLVIKELFYNTPARMKFLKKDVSEGNAAAAVVERAALSHPEIAFKLIRDGKQTLTSYGDGKLSSAVYSILGREFSASLIPVNGTTNKVTVTGFTCKPVSCRQSRNMQFTFINSRLVQSGTVTAAAEQAYKNCAMVGKFPAFVLFLEMPYDNVDVNVHPAKTQVRFSEEKTVFDAVYGAVKMAITVGDARPEINFANKQSFGKMSVEQYRQEAVKVPATPVEKIYNTDTLKRKSEYVPAFRRKAPVESYDKPINVYKEPEEETYIPKAKPQFTEETAPVRGKEEIRTEEVAQIKNGEPLVSEEDVRLIGEAFSTYIVAEKGNSVYLIDKHAAHERILFNSLKETATVEVQPLLIPLNLKLTAGERDALLSNTQLLLKAGFEIEDFGESVMVRAIPAMLSGEDVERTVCEAADCLITKGRVENERLDDIFHTVACKAAIKAGYKNADTELLSLAKKVLSSKDIMYCPHGRPVAFEIKRKELEKQFGRIQ